jgi:hypothetical protein
MRGAGLLIQQTFNISCIAILESVRKERMAENTASFDFELDRNDTAAIAALDQKASSYFDHRDPVSEVDILARLCLIIRWNRIVQHPRLWRSPTISTTRALPASLTKRTHERRSDQPRATDDDDFHMMTPVQVYPGVIRQNSLSWRS